jgi:hypothetical protein
MMRNLIVLGCAGLLALGLSFGTFAGSITDSDTGGGDGVPDGQDNCVFVPNGPLNSTGQCNGQEDGDLDGYGNPCDYDVDNDGATGLPDVAATLDNAAIVSTDPNYDYDCDGAAGLPDVAGSLDNAAIVAQPGPSGLPCAGTAVCVAP